VYIYFEFVISAIAAIVGIDWIGAAIVRCAHRDNFALHS
jgi:hypothetical protein